MPQYKILLVPFCQYDILTLTNHSNTSFEQSEPVIDIIKSLKRFFDALLYRHNLLEYDQDPSLAQYGIRSFYCSDYKVFYYTEHTTKTIYILRVIHEMFWNHPCQFSSDIEDDMLV